ncbi:hypothetical protein [Deinococcus ficus]|uniref:hypothetical protein n=1 Tax=Deinococcus ficus TaxID=317577 RepID=UPI0003B40433|nr:hypothetical protein [Deinococcus ficus]
MLALTLAVPAAAQDSGLTVETQVLLEQPTILGPATVQTAPRPCRSYCVTP